MPTLTRKRGHDAGQLGADRDVLRVAGVDRGSTMPAPATVRANGDRGGSTSGVFTGGGVLRPHDVRDGERQRRPRRSAG